MATFDELFERPARIEDGYAPFSSLAYLRAGEVQGIR